MIHPSFKHIAILAAASLTVSCATTSNTKSKEEMAVAAGFKAIKPTKPDQTAILEKLPADKFTRVSHAGKTYYVLPDRADGQAYVGSPKQFQAYQEDSQAREDAVEYSDSTSKRARQTSEDNNSPGVALLEGWDWSQTDGQTD